MLSRFSYRTQNKAFNCWNNIIKSDAVQQGHPAFAVSVIKINHHQKQLLDQDNYVS